MNICLFGASSEVIDRSYLEAAYALGAEIAARGHALVYGGGAQGIMGAAARGAADNGGTIVGVAPSFFNVDGVLFDRCTEFIYTDTMRQRKQIMEDRSDAILLAPGGFGSFEEFFEILTLKQLGRHNKPIAVLNTNGYYDPMQAMIRNAVDQKFAASACLNIYRLFACGSDALDYLEGYKEEAVDIRHLKNI